jgi:hypothetical protein
MRAVNDSTYVLHPIGRVRSALTGRSAAPKQGAEAGTEAVVEIFPAFRQGLDGLRENAECFVLTWLHQGERATLRVHPRDDLQNPLTGVFATRSPIARIRSDSTRSRYWRSNPMAGCECGAWKRSTVRPSSTSSRFFRVKGRDR